MVSENTLTPCVKYVKNDFRQIATVVSDGYEFPSIKYEEHIRRNARGASAEALIDDASSSTSPEGVFLENIKKQGAIHRFAIKAPHGSWSQDHSSTG